MARARAPDAPGRVPGMQMRQLGAGGPEISVVGFGSWEAGGMHWGPNSSEQEVIAAIDAGLDAGMTWVDTGEVYGNGVSERIVGRAVAGRDDVLVFTKWRPTRAAALRPTRCAVRSTPRCSGWEGITSTSTRCTGRPTTCRSRRRGARWPSSCLPARRA